MLATIIIIAIGFSVTIHPRYAHHLVTWMSLPHARINAPLVNPPPPPAEIPARPFDEIPLYRPPRPVPPIPNYWLTHDCLN